LFTNNFSASKSNFQIYLLRAHPDYPLPLGRRACPVVALTPWMRLFGHTDPTPSSEKIK